MANRILRDWTDSFAVDDLDANEERFFVRLIMKADDFGCFHADVRLLKANLFPLKEDITGDDISEWLKACEKAGLIVTYMVGEKEYLQVINFNQRLRQKTNKFPLPPDETTVCEQGKGTPLTPCGHDADNGRLETKRREVETKGVRREENDAPPPDLKNSNLFRQPRIPTWEEVHLTFVRNGGNEEMAKAFYDRNQSTEWFFKGSPITNYVTMVDSFIRNWKKNENKGQKNDGHTNPNPKLDKIKRAWIESLQKTA